ncbi:MAG: prepilin-type N-terminal cleavage/methylation domain-containing protein [Verrucomicrobiae bacterium]|nr:prepilin-type N-terminal cleavage/methylation domain-containing protein [Verrucomicrobiae bacterium]
MANRWEKAQAFTLIELLVVILILALLAALLMPALAAAKQRTRTVQCANNHRALALAWRLYGDDHQQRLPWTVDDGDGLPFTNWVAGHLRNPVEATNTALLVDSKRSLLAPFVTHAALYKCPADPSPLARSVSMNNRLNPVRFLKPVLVIGGYGTNFMVYRRASDIRDPSRIFVLLDERYDSINEGNFAVDLSNTGTYDGHGVPTPYWWLDTPAAYHNQGVNLSFADGHVETHRWQERTTLGPLGVTGFRRTSSMDRDISWLQFHTAEPVQPGP